ncbi:sigma-70 family RNA polymerase sigma factor [Dyadobacter sp. CY345]|uniref:RNA polymerase sigma factor n=1 Tax=Dyadobacter sp. CY345 TaxID=2909335 RepID=UPI001F2F52B6|nr:sigma-70 family RNA polymerase sigma factor [Dyadobacter sp. CY345]MCF2446516.1 sigma-70 family RNA polymerase sigma factor [Dyadobacter sp. CY345]
MSSSVPALSEMQLIEKFVQGDRDSFTILYKKYWYKLYLIAQKRLNDRAVSEELTQEIFVQLWERRETLEINSLENYLVKAIRYAVIDYIRNEIVKNNYLHHYKAFVAHEESETENVVAVNDLSTFMEAGLKTLPEKSQEVFRLSRIENWPVARIASHLQLTEKGVEYHITKSIKTLKVYLKDFVAIAILFFMI